MNTLIKLIALCFLFVLFSFSHAWNGQTNFLPAIDSSSLPLATRTTIFYVWHIITAENLIFGIAFLVMSFYEDSSKVRFTAWTVAFILITRWIVIFGGTLFKNKDAVTQTLTDSIAIIVLVGLIILGSRKNISIWVKAARTHNTRFAASLERVGFAINKIYL